MEILIKVYSFIPDVHNKMRSLCGSSFPIQTCVTTRFFLSLNRFDIIWKMAWEARKYTPVNKKQAAIKPATCFLLID